MAKTDLITELAQIAAEKNRAKGGSYNTREFADLYRQLPNIAKRFLNMFDLPYDRECFGSAFNDAFLEALDKYDVSKPFLPHFKTIFRSRYIDELRKNIRFSKYCKTESELIFDDKEDDNNSFDLDNLSGNNYENVSDIRDEIEHGYRLIAAVCIEQKKAYSKSPKLCYPPLFFTDNIVYNVFETEHFDKVVQSNANKFDEAASLDFLNTLLTGKCSSVAEIDKFKCRPLSEFTDDPKDYEEPCCNGEPDHRVFNNYLVSIGKKSVTQSAISQQNKNYKALIGEKLDLKLPGKKERV